MINKTDYSNITSVEELYEHFPIRSQIVLEKKNEELKDPDKSKKHVSKPQDKLEVIYAEHDSELNNIFKHIYYSI